MGRCRRHGLPADDAAFQGRLGVGDGALARQAVSVLKDLMVDRRAFDRIIASGGYISVPTGSAPDGNAIPVSKEVVGPRHGCGGLHRLRRLCGGVSECFGGIVHGREDDALEYSAARESRSAICERFAWSRR